MSELITMQPDGTIALSSQAVALPAARVELRVRVATRDDLAFMDALQKKHSKQLGFFPRAQMEGYVDAGNVLIAEDLSGERLGYVAYRDRYLKRDELGVIYQMCVTEAARGKLVAAHLLKSVFERSPRGCRLFCCWCAQDLAANRFWEAMGFVPIAFRTGSANRGSKGKPRVHLFWQKRIRDGEGVGVTPWWYPSETGGGAIKENRLVLPVPMGMKWSDAMPVLLPECRDEGGRRDETKKALPLSRAKSSSSLSPQPSCLSSVRALSRPGFARVPAMALAPATPMREKKTREKRVAAKNDPALVKKARDLRDRWFEHVNADPDALTPPAAKYALACDGRVTTAGVAATAELLVDGEPVNLLAA